MIYDHAGNEVAVGRVHKTLVEPFIANTALPAWLTSDAGTVTFQGTDTTKGSGRVTTGAVSTNVARLKTSFALASAQFTRIDWTIEGFNTDIYYAYDLVIGLAGTNCGWDLRQTGLFSGTAAAATGRVYRAAAAHDDVTTNFPMIQISAKRQNITLSMFPRTKELYVKADDQVMAYIDGSTHTYTDGTITPMIELTTNEAVAHYFSLQQVRLDLWSN